LISSEPSGILSGTIPFPTVIFSFLAVSDFTFSAVEFFTVLKAGIFALPVFGFLPLTDVAGFA